MSGHVQFEVRMLAPEGVVAVHVEAGDENGAAQQVRERGLPILSVAARRSYSPRRESFSLTLFTRELLALLRAGLGLIEAIRALAERAPNLGSSALRGVLDQLSDGKPLSAALACHPHSFPLLYVETVRAAERTGAIEEALTRFVQYQGQVDQIRQKLISALIYPALLVLVGAAVALFLVAYVVPRFSGVYLELGKELPWASRILFELGGFVDAHLLECALAGMTIAAAVVIALRTGTVRARLARQLCALPIFGERLRIYRLTRLYRTVAMLLHGGVPVVSALRMAAGLLDAASRTQLDSAIAQVRNGGSLSAALEKNGLSTSIAGRMLQVGERSGDMAGLVEQAAQFHEEELGRWVERVTRMLEPCLMLLMGLLIGAIVVLMYMPIFDLAGTLQ